MQFEFFFPIFFSLSLPRNFDLKKKLWNYHDKFLYVCLSNFKIRYIFLLFFCLGCNNFCYCYIFFFVFSKIFKLIFVVYLVKKIILLSNFMFWKFFTVWLLFAVNVCVQIYFLMQFFFILSITEKNKNKTFFGKSDLPLFSIFLINFLWSSNPWRSLEYSQNGQKNKYLGNNFALWYFFFSRKHT